MAWNFGQRVGLSLALILLSLVISKMPLTPGKSFERGTLETNLKIPPYGTVYSQDIRSYTTKERRPLCTYIAKVSKCYLHDQRSYPHHHHQHALPALLEHQELDHGHLHPHVHHQGQLCPHHHHQHALPAPLEHQELDHGQLHPHVHPQGHHCPHRKYCQDPETNP